MQVQAARGYRAASISTADRLRLIVLCYEGCIANAARAVEEMKKGHVGEKGVYLSKATAIVTELMNTLDKEHGGEIAEQLEALYGYVLRSFLEANIRKEPALIEAAVRVLRELKEAWVALADKGGLG